jgi:hypothetical protein
MWTVPNGWASALTASHAATCRVEAWQNSVLIDTADMIDGTVSVSARNRIRRTLDLSMPESLWPAEVTDMLSPYAAELRVYRGVAHFDPIPVFRGRVQTVERGYLSGQIRVSAADLMADINADQFDTPRAAPAGTPIPQAIAALIVETLPDASVVDLTMSAAVVPAGLMWDRDRGQAVDDLAKSVGAEVVCGPDGSFTIRPVPTIDGATAVWALTDGTAGTIVADTQSQSRDGVANSIVVLAEQASGAAPIRVVVRDTNPDSPTFYGGAFGRATRFYSSPLISAAVQAATAGQAILARTVGITRQRDVTCVPNPALDAGDVVSISVGGVAETHIADEIGLPLHADGGAMTLRTRSTRTDPAGLT